jgi:alkylhydroperoxidase/carboxymuconolactone decarboxylase family protein YurZ
MTKQGVLAADHTDDVMRGGVAVATMAAVSTDRRDLIMSDTESRVLDSLAAMNLTSLEQVKGLDPQTVVLVRFAALVALDAAPLSYLTHLAVGQEAGINAEQVEDVLLALAPLVGSARVVSAGSKIARALGIAVLGAEADVEANDDES